MKAGRFLPESCFSARLLGTVHPPSPFLQDYLEVAAVLLQVSLNAAAQLQQPAPLSLQGCLEGLQGEAKQSGRGRQQREEPFPHSWGPTWGGAVGKGLE